MKSKQSQALIVKEQLFLKFCLKTICKIFKINKYTCRNVDFVTGDLLTTKKIQFFENGNKWTVGAATK